MTKTKRLRIAGIFLAAVMIVATFGIFAGFGAIEASAADAYYDGTPVRPEMITSENYFTFGLNEENWSAYGGFYAIRNAAELYGFASMVNSGNRWINAVVLHDIKVNESVVPGEAKHLWVPIGSSEENSFMGIFDGGGHTISGLYSSLGDVSKVGLFGEVGQYNTVTPIRIRNVVLKNSYFRAGDELGSIVGNASGWGTWIENCSVGADVTLVVDGGGTYEEIGGILGGVDARANMYSNICAIRNCAFLGKIEFKRLNFKDAAVNKVLSYKGAITGVSYVGKNAYEHVTVNDCFYVSGCMTDKNGNNIDYFGFPFNYGAGGVWEGNLKYTHNGGCTQLDSANASHTCQGMPHVDVVATCDGYNGMSGHDFCIICGNVTSGSRTERPVWGHLYIPATCQSPSRCFTCTLTRGSKDENNHVKTLWTVNLNDKSTHIYTHECCGIIIETDDHTVDENGYCEICDYTCEHTDMSGGICHVCGKTGIPYVLRYWDEASKKVHSTMALVPEYTLITEDTTSMRDGWYVLHKDVTVNSKIFTSGTVNILLMDGCTLTASQGIFNEITSVLNIYGQNEETGTIVATGDTGHPGLGGQISTCGQINIFGGTIRATGGLGAPGIGSARRNTSTREQSVNVFGGNVYATGGLYSTGIGSGESYGDKIAVSPTITIRGGYVEARAYSGSTSAGIGGADGSSGCGTITISGGTVLAVGGKADIAGIGNGSDAKSGNIIITGGNVRSITGAGGHRIGASKQNSSVDSITDGNGSTVSQKQITLSGATAGTVVTEINGVFYGTNDVKTMDTNKIYVYLPSDMAITSIVAGGKEYNCSKDHSTFYVDHTMSLGVCTRCGYKCPHDYKNSFCTLCGIECSHDYKETFRFDATCSAQGIAKYKCMDCKHEYDEILDSLGHDYTWTYDDFSHSAVCANCDYTPQGLHDYEDGCVCECGRISTERKDHANLISSVVDATCTEDSYIKYTCSDCDTVFKDVISHTMLGHTGGEATCNSPAICERCSEPYGEALTHSGGQATCTQKAICEHCGEGYGELLEHSADEDNDCTKDDLCIYCGILITAGLESHEYDDNHYCIHEYCYVTEGCTITLVDGDTQTEVDVHYYDYYYFSILPDKDGMTFLGWDENGDGVVDYAGIGVPNYVYVEGPMTYTAVYGEIMLVRYFRIGLDSGEYELQNTVEVSQNGTLVLEHDYAYNYIPLGWATEPGGEKVYEYGQEITVTETMNLYTVWKPFTVSFDLDGGSWLDENGDPVTESITENTEFYTLPTKPGYKFLHFLGVDQYGSEITESFNVDGDTGELWLSVYISGEILYTAVWEECTEHSFTNGACEICAYECTHENKDGEVCRTCGETIHAYGTDWVKDANEHWNECPCGEKINKALHADTDGDEKCDTCGKDMPTTSDTDAETEYETESKTESKTESETESGTESGTESNTDSETDTESDAETTESETDVIASGVDNPKDKKVLPTGAIIAIVAGSVVAVGAGAFTLVWFVIKKKSSLQSSKKVD